VERLHLAENKLQEAPITRLDRKCLCLDERLSEGRDRLGMGVSRGRFLGELGQVLHGLGDVVGPRVVVRQPVVDVVEPSGIQGLEGSSRCRMQRASPRGDEALVGHLLGQGMPEGVLEIGEEPALVEELRGLELRQTPAEHVLGLLGDGLEESKRDVLADNRGSLEQPLVLGREPVDARGAPVGAAARGQAPRRAAAATMMSAAWSGVKASVLMTRS
jgi:hypothetical protein